MKSRPTVLVSLVLALALPADSLLYAMLPLHAAEFGLSLATAGVLLSANRIVRLAAYPMLARGAASGLRRFTIAMAALAASSTLTFAIASGPAALLLARVAWGLAYGGLSLAALAYATSGGEGDGVRVGLSLSLREAGPLVALVAGAAAVPFAGIRTVLAAFAAVAFCGIAIAATLPDVERLITTEAQRTLRSWTRPAPADWLAFAAGFAADGMFAATIALALGEHGRASRSAATAALLLALKRVAVVLLAPVAGRLADRFGARTLTAIGFAACAAGAALVAGDAIVSGALLFSSGAAAASTAIPMWAGRAGEGGLGAFARNGIARDAGAAAGPLVAVALFAWAGAQVTYGGMSAALALLAAAIACSRVPALQPRQRGTLVPSRYTVMNERER